MNLVREMQLGAEPKTLGVSLCDVLRLCNLLVPQCIQYKSSTSVLPLFILAKRTDICQSMMD